MKGKKYVKKNYVSGCQAQPWLIRNFNSKRTFSQIEKSSLDFDKIFALYLFPDIWKSIKFLLMQK